MLAQAHRLRRSADFQAVIRRGRRCGDRLLVVYAAPAARAVSAVPAAAVETAAMDGAGRRAGSLGAG
ncbi:MAG: ribonuclease P protein component, partial [Bifidobacteriaceae bacterium]|nr:ribonuclease P protein component [Bifidobacteriaceae bacterium]